MSSDKVPCPLCFGRGRVYRFHEWVEWINWVQRESCVSDQACPLCQQDRLVPDTIASAFALLVTYTPEDHGWVHFNIISAVLEVYDHAD